jgi:LytS/YehU family sensor histidine kinase
MTDRIKKFKYYLETWNGNLADQQREEVEKWIAENDIKRAEAEQIAQQMEKHYFLCNILETILNREINEDLEDPIFSDDKKGE